MATRIVSWSGKEHTVSPSLSKTPSMVSFDSILSDNSVTPSLQCAVESWPPRLKYIPSQVIETSGTRTCASASMYPGAGSTDGSFVRHHRYFFKDGNVTFLVDNTLYCVHRYFFSRDSIYFSTRFTQLDIRDHEALPTIISLGDIERKDFDAFLSVLYPENFEENDLSYEEWKSVLHLSTRWNFGSIRKLALGSIEPPTPHDRLLLARTYLIDDWVVPALSAMCERTKPLTLSEAREMNIEDVVLVSTVREHIRGRTIQVDAAEIPLRVEAEQLIALGHRISPSPSRESEDDTPMASLWNSKSRWEKAEAEARAKAQEATRLQLDAEAKERTEAEENAHQEAEKARKYSEEKGRLEAEKACKDAEEKARLEVEEKSRKDAEDKGRAKKARKVAMKREARAKAAEAEATRQAETEADKMKCEAEAKAEEEANAAKEKLEAEAKAEEARIKANEDAVNKAKPEEEATQWRGGWRVNEQERAETGWL